MEHFVYYDTFEKLVKKNISLFKSFCVSVASFLSFLILSEKFVVCSIVHCYKYLINKCTDGYVISTEKKIT